MRISIKLKSGAVLAGLLLLTVLVLSLLVLQGVRQNQQEQYENFLAQQSRTANLYLRQQYLTGERVELDRFLQSRGTSLAVNLGGLSGLPVVLYDGSGKEVGSSLPVTTPAGIQEALRYARQGKVAYLEVEDTLYYLAPITITYEQSGVVQFTYSLQSTVSFYDNLRRLFGLIGAVTFVVSFGVGYLYFNSVAGAVQKLQQAAEQIRLGKYEGIPRLRRRDELGELSQGIEYMAQQIKSNIQAMEAEESKLRLAVAKLQALEQQQKQFIGNISHEFKTPLTAIKAYADLMEMYQDDPELITTAVTNISKETSRLGDMVEKSLRLTALDKYDFEFKAEVLEMADLLEDVSGRMAGKVQKFGLVLHKNLQPAEIKADRESMLQVVINLMDNAIKYNQPQGQIFLRSFTRGQQAIIEVEDTGIGIPPEARAKIFEAFFTVNLDRSRQSGGTGLGLTLVKALVEQQLGTIELIDTGHGSKFVLIFPTSQVATKLQ